MITRRKFLHTGMQGILLAAAAPAIIKVDALMRVRSMDDRAEWLRRGVIGRWKGGLQIFDSGFHEGELVLVGEVPEIDVRPYVIGAELKYSAPKVRRSEVVWNGRMEHRYWADKIFRREVNNYL